MTNYKPRSKIVLEELLSDQIRPQPTTVVEGQNEETTSPYQNVIPPRRSGRVVRPPARYREINNGKDDPLTYCHTMEDSEEEK